MNNVVPFPIHKARRPRDGAAVRRQALRELNHILAGIAAEREAIRHTLKWAQDNTQWTPLNTR